MPPTVAEVLERLLPSDRSVSLPYVQVIHDPSRVGPLYEQLVSRTKDELLVFNGRRTPSLVG